MKRLSTLCMALALVLPALTLFASPASAKVTPCVQITIQGAGYPADGQRLLDCRRAPVPDHKDFETNLVLSVNGFIHALPPAIQTDLSNKKVTYYVFTLGQDALDTLQIVGGSGPGANETGRSWVIPGQAQNPGLTKPVVSIWIYTPTQWNNGNPIAVSHYPARQNSGTVHHETGHQMDRIWAQMAGLAPAATSLLSQNDILYTHAQAYDIAHLSANERNWINANDKRLLQASELFPVEFAIVAGGGTQQMEDTFVQPRFSCTYRYL